MRPKMSRVDLDYQVRARRAHGRPRPRSLARALAPCAVLR